MRIDLVRTTRGVAPGLAAAALLCSAAGGATAAGGTGADSSDYQSASLTLTESAAGRPTGNEVRIDYTNPDDPDGKPPSVKRVVEVFPEGTRIDTGAPALCRASDAELMAMGPSACPAGSVVGSGYLTLDTGVPGPGRYLEEDVTFLNNTDELIYLTDDRRTGARTVVRAQVRGNKVITETPFLPGAGADGSAIDVVRASFPELVRTRDGQRRSYVTTPDSCPATGHWLTKLRFDYQDGTTQTETTRAPCER